MKAIPQPAPRGGLFFTMLVLVALWLRGLLPVGYMPVAVGVDASGWPGFALCRAGIRLPDADKPSTSLVHGTDGCLFAGLAALPAPAGPIMRLQAAWIVLATRLGVPSADPLTIILGVPPARGPPVG